MTTPETHTTSTQREQAAYHRLHSLDQGAIETATEDDIAMLIDSAKAADSLCHGWDDPKTMFEVHQRRAAFHLRRRARELSKTE